MNKDPKDFWRNLEFKIGKYAVQIIGVIIFLIGSGFFFKYAIDKQLISPAVRVLLGVITATILLVISEKLSSKFYYWTQGCCFGGIVLYYLSTYAAHNIYFLTSLNVMESAVILISLLAVILSIRHDSLLIATLSLIGFWTSFKLGSCFFPLTITISSCLLYSLLAYFKNWDLLSFMSYALYCLEIFALARELSLVSKIVGLLSFCIIFILIPYIIVFVSKRMSYTFETFMVPLTSGASFLTAIAIFQMFGSQKAVYSVAGLIFGVIYLLLTIVILKQKNPALNYFAGANFLVSTIFFLCPVFVNLEYFNLSSSLVICALLAFLIGLFMRLIFLRIISYISIYILFFSFWIIGYCRNINNNLNETSFTALILVSVLIIIVHLIQKKKDWLTSIERSDYFTIVLKCGVVATILTWFFAINWGSTFDYLIGVAVISSMLGIWGYFFKDQIIRYTSCVISLVLTTFFIQRVFTCTECFSTIQLLKLSIAIILSNQIIFLLEKYLKYDYLDLIETKYIKQGAAKVSALAIAAVGYNAITLLNQAALTWENKGPAAWFTGTDGFYLWLSVLYVALGLTFTLMSIDFIGEINLVASGYAALLFIHYNALSWQNATLAALFVSKDALDMWISIFLGTTALIYIFIGLIKKIWSLRLVGLGLVVMAFWKLWFVIMCIKELEYRIFAFMSIGIALILVSFIYQKLEKYIE